MLKISGGNEMIDPIKLLEQGNIKEGFKVADLGCGSSGHFIFPAAHLVGDKGLVYAVDILKPVLDSVERRARFEGLNNVMAVWGDLERVGGVKIENKSIDIALLVNTLFQVKDKQMAVKETARILKSGGVLIVGEWKTAGTPFGPPVATRVDPANMKNLALGAGLKWKNDFEAGPYHYGMVFQE